MAGNFDEHMGMQGVTFGMCGRANPAALRFVPAQFPQNPSNPAKFPHFSRKRELLKSFVYMRDACKLLTSATLTR